MRLVAIASLLACLLLWLSGCQRSALPRASDQSAAVEYGALPAVRTSHHRELRREIARLDEEHATPIQLELAQASTGSPSLDQRGDRWARVLKPKQWLKLQRRLTKLFPGGNINLSLLQTRNAQEFANENEPYRREIRQMLLEYPATPRVPHNEGLLTDLSFIDVARVYLRWEQTHAARLFVEDQRADVIQAFAGMFEMVERLAHAGHLVPRLAAVQLRHETWTLLQETIDAGRFRRPNYEAMQRITDAQLTAWPSDSEVWIADRAQALHTYEMIRDGYLPSILTQEEINRFRDTGVMDQLLAVAERIDGDQYYYLQTMRRIINDCKLPYRERNKELQRIYEEQRQLQSEPDFPAVAVHLFLAELKQAQRELALDRALCEAWQLGFSMVLDPVHDTQRLNSMTGEPFVVVLDDGAISIWGAGEDGDRPVMIPRLPDENTSRAMRPRMRQR